MVDGFKHLGSGSKAGKFWVEYIENKPLDLYPFKASTFKPLIRRDWSRAAKKSIKINPHLLRKWNATELARLGVPDRYVDAFQGRLPQTILARHYSDYTPQNLLKIYKQANLKILD